MPPVGFEHTTPAGERLQTYALDRAATGTGFDDFTCCRISVAHDKRCLSGGNEFPFVFHTSYRRK